MDRSEPVGKGREIKSLLELIQQLPHNQDGQLQAAVNPYYQQWSAYHSAYLAAADTFRRTPATSRGGSGVNPWFFVVATVLNTIVAAVLAVLITLSVVRQDPGYRPELAGAAASVADAASPAGRRTSMMVVETAAARPIEMQQIGSPEQPLRLEALKPTPFPLLIQPPEASMDTFILVLSGVPARAELLGADRIGSDSWLLPPYSSSRLQLTMPEWSAALIEVGMELRRTNGAIAARSKAWLTVPPPAVAKGEKKLDPAAMKEVLQSGDRLISRGDIVAARAVYERAAEMGSAQAALALGSTYDPTRLWSLGVFGMVGNTDKARHWYMRADQLGHPNAKERLRGLAE